MTIRIALWAVALIHLAGCANTRAPVACPAASDARSAKIFYATDRQKDLTGEMDFGQRRTDPPVLYMGTKSVRIGPEHRLGKVDPAIAIQLEHQRSDSPDAPQTDTLRHSDADIEAFMEKQVRPAVRRTSPGRSRQVLLYVHGYNTTFDFAIRNAAQLAGDLDLIGCSGQNRGVAIVYSWPAQNTLLSYLADEENAEWTQQRLAPFLQALARICRAENAELTLIAHSMGARALVRSLADLANACHQERRAEPLADHVVLLAPDIGKGLFDQYVERFLPLIHHLTIYVSTKDRALGLSSLLHGGHGRLGLIESTVLVALEITGLHRDDHRELGFVAGEGGGKVDMIDVSASVAGSFGHSYEDPAFMADLRELIYRDTPAGVGKRANLERREIHQGFIRNLATLKYYQLRTR